MPGWAARHGPKCYGRLAAGGEAAPRAAATDTPAIHAARLLHRVAATAVLILVLTLALVCFARLVWWQEGWMSVALIALTVFLAVLGRWTTGSRLPAVALGNLIGGFAMLVLLWWLRLRSQDRRDAPCVPALLPWARWALLGLTLQIVLGALLSAGFAAASCPTLPECHGLWWPTPTPWQAFNPWQAPLPQVLQQGSPAAVALHMAHRFAAVINLALCAGLAAAAWAAGARYRSAAALVLALLVAQVALGALSVLAGLPLLAVVAHNLTAALLLLALVSLGARLRGA